MWICGTANKKLRAPTSGDLAYGKGRGCGVVYWTHVISSAIGDGLLTFNFKPIIVNALHKIIIKLQYISLFIMAC